jgi:hypothetical protein
MYIPRIGEDGVFVFLVCALFIRNLGKLNMKLTTTGITQLLVTNLATEIAKRTRGV